MAKKLKRKGCKTAMYLHLGQNVMVKNQEIVGIFDLDTSTVKKSTQNYIYNAEKEKRVSNVSAEDLPKSFVVCAGDFMKKNEIFVSPLATATLLKRKEIGSFL